MNPFTTIVSTLESLFPDLETKVIRPKLDDGVWSLEIDHSGNSIAVEWDPRAGYGISTVRAESYGEGSDEIYREAIPALSRLLALLALEQSTAPQRPLTLSQLRERRQCTQQSLASKLDMRQSSLSAFEHREDVQIGTLRDFVAALNGKLELLATFDDVCYVIETKPTRRRSRVAAASPVRRWQEDLRDTADPARGPRRVV